MAKRIRMNEVPCWQEERNFTKWLADNIELRRKYYWKKHCKCVY